MAPTNNFLPFCPTDTGTNLLTQSDYLAATDRSNGNQPGVASSKLNNKAIRQGTYVTSQLAQFLANQLNNDVLDDNTPNRLLSQFLATLKPYAPNVTSYSSGSNTWKMRYVFYIVAGNATAAATYTNNGITFTVVSTVAGATEVKMTGDGDPTNSGTLTKASGTGDATLTFYAFRKPLYLRVKAAGAGGGGAGSGSTTGSAATDGGNTTFGSTIVVVNGGTKGAFGADGGVGGTASLSGGAVGSSFSGAKGGPGPYVSGATGHDQPGGTGGSNFFGGAGAGGVLAGSNAAANSGSGGGGGGIAGVTNQQAGSGGGAGAYAEVIIMTPASTYVCVIGSKGTKGGAGTSGFAGGDGADGYMEIEEHYQ